MRLAVYCDYGYRRAEGALWAELAFVHFLTAVATQLDRVTLVGRLEPRTARWHHRVADHVGFQPLPFYTSLARPTAAARTIVQALGRFWRLLADVDAVWLFGPHPLSLAFAALAAVRRRPIALGVRQDLPAYTRTRRPGRRSLWLAAVALEACYRALARRCPVLVVGPELGRHYGAARELLEIVVSLASEAHLAASTNATAGDPGGTVRVLSVGRLDAEKNPLLLADVLGELIARGGRDWELVVCGDGALSGALAETLRRRGLDGRARLLGYVPVEAGLWDLYRSSHLLLHCAWTEGVPQVLLEAFACRLPVVATAVGGVPDAVEGAALLVPPDDAGRCADALEALANDPALRARLVAAGLRRAREQSLEAQSRRVARFLTDTLGRPCPST